MSHCTPYLIDVERVTPRTNSKGEIVKKTRKCVCVREREEEEEVDRIGK